MSQRLGRKGGKNMYKTLRKVLLPFFLVIVLVCSSLLAVACKPEEEGEEKVTYSVTVTLDSGVEGVTLTSLKAQWMSGTTAASEQIALNAEGKASVELKSGNYTVELIGVPATAEYAKASVTAAKPDATIKISKKAPVGPTAQKLDAPTQLKVVDGTLSWKAVANASGYVIYDGNTKLGEVAANVLTYDVSALAVGNHSLTVVAKGDGTNYTDSANSTAYAYKVEEPAVTPEGGTDYWYENESWEWAHHEGVPYAISAVGKYYIPVQFEITTQTDEWDGSSYSKTTIYAHTIKFVAPEDGEHSYTFSWNTELYSLTYENNQDGFESLDDVCLLADDNNGSLLFSLSKGEEIIIVLNYNYDLWENPLTEGDEIGYELTITSGDPIAEGSIVRPFAISEVEGEHSAPAGYSNTEAYFQLPKNEDYFTYKITFADGVQVAVMQEGSAIALSSGDELTPAEYSNTLLKVSAANGASIAFSLEKTIRTGSLEKPIELTKGEEASYSFADYHSVWYSFVADATQLYHIGVSGTYVQIYNSLPTDEDDFPTYEINSDGKADLYLEAGTYYIKLVAQWGGNATLVITDSSDEQGAILNPIELNIGTNDADYSDIDILYFVYTANADGLLTIEHNAEYGVYMYLFSDANYTVSLGEPEDTAVSYAVKNGDILYIYITSYSNLTISLSIKLDAPENVKVQDGVLSWDAVAGAVGYMIYDGDKLIDSNVAAETLTYNLAEAELAPGAHDIYVVARGYGNYFSSEKSDYATYAVAYELGTDEEGVNVIFEDGAVTINLLTGVKTDTQYAVVLTSAADTSAEDFLDYFASGIYTLTYNGKNYVYDASNYLAVYRELDWNMALITFSSGVMSFTIDVNMPSEANVLYVNVSLVEMSDDDLHLIVLPLELNEGYEEEPLPMKGSAWQYSFEASAYGNYSIVLSNTTGINASDDVLLNNGQEPIDGTYNSDNKSISFDFFANAGDTFYITVYNNTESNTSISYTITVIMLPWVCGDFTLGEELNVSLTGDNVVSNPEANKELTFVAPLNGIYKLSVKGMNINLFGAYQAVIIKDSTGAITVEVGNQLDSIGEATFTAKKDAEITFKLTKQVGENYDVNLTLIITLEEVKEEMLSLTDTVLATIGTSEQDAGVIKLDMDNLIVGNEYNVYVSFLPLLGSLTELKMVYGSQTISLAIIPSDGSRLGFEGTFTLEEGVSTILIYASITSTLKTTVALEEVKDELVLSLNGSVTINLTSEHTVIALDTSSLTHRTTYVITANFFAMWVDRGGVSLQYGESIVNLTGAGDWENSKVEFTYSELVEPAVIEIFTNDSSMSWENVTLTLTAK